MSGNAIEVNGRWYQPAPNSAPTRGRGGRRQPTARSRQWAQGLANVRRSQPQQLLVGSMPTNLPTWKSFPGEQWHEVSGYSFPDRWGSGTIAYMTLRSELSKIRTLHDTTKVYSVMIGFVCKSDGYAGFMDGFDINNATGPVAPDRIRVKRGKYCAKQQVFPTGTTVSEVKANWNLVWDFDTAPATGAVHEISITKFYVSTTPLPGVKPPSNFLVVEE
uniref:RNA3 capsid n=1 Tax=Citrus variegation virus TaxID=37127 RepID=Q8V327_9BROM|nr:RNA3 capsid [Citrus variegation virus]